MIEVHFSNMKSSVTPDESQNGDQALQNDSRYVDASFSHHP